jgi:hypothetical protein
VKKIDQGQTDEQISEKLLQEAQPEIAATAHAAVNGTHRKTHRPSAVAEDCGQLYFLTR